MSSVISFSSGATTLLNQNALLGPSVKHSSGQYSCAFARSPSGRTSVSHGKLYMR